MNEHDPYWEMPTFDVCMSGLAYWSSNNNLTTCDVDGNSVTAPIVLDINKQSGGFESSI